MKELGPFIKEKRKAAGLTQKQLAQKIGKAEITIRQYESGARSPDFETKLAIANVLNFHFDEYSTEVYVEEPTPKPREQEDYYEEDLGYYDVGTRKAGDKYINELIYYPPRTLLDGLTREEVELVRDYRDFLIWKRKQKRPGNNGS